MVILNVTEPPVSEKIVCFSASENEIERKIVLSAIVRARYRHPDAPGEAFIEDLETRVIGVFDTTSEASAAAKLVRYANDNARMFVQAKHLYI